jgi:hypothetical protein
MGIYTGAEWAFGGKVEEEVSRFMDTARIPGTTDSKSKLFSAEELAGYWKESGAEFANYVTTSGNFVRSETIATAAYFEMGTNGNYTRTLLSVGSLGNGKERDSGKWSVDDDELVLSGSGRYTLFGSSNDLKVGRFLVIGSSRTLGDPYKPCGCGQKSRYSPYLGFAIFRVTEKLKIAWPRNFLSGGPKPKWIVSVP